MTSSIEFSNLPPEIHQMIVERCDYLSRNNLLITSRQMKNAVDSSKIFIPSVKISEGLGGAIVLNFIFQKDWEKQRKYVKTEMGTMVNGITQIDGKTPTEAMFDAFQKFCIRKQVTTIGCLYLETGSFVEELPQKFEEILKEQKTSKLLKIQSVCFKGYNSEYQLPWIVLKYCKSIKNISIKNTTEPVDLFVKADHLMLNQLNSLEVLSNVEATQEELLALSASKIHLQSDKFTPEIMMSMLTKWMAERKPAESYFVLKNVSENDMSGALTEKVPKEFVKMDSTDEQVLCFSMPLPDSTNQIHLRIGIHGIYVLVENTTDDACDYFGVKKRERCLKTVDCRCHELFPRLRYVDFFEDDEFFEEDDESDTVDYDSYDDFDGGWRSDMSDFEADDDLDNVDEIVENVLDDLNSNEDGDDGGLLEDLDDSTEEELDFDDNSEQDYDLDEFLQDLDFELQNDEEDYFDLNDFLD